MGVTNQHPASRAAAPLKRLGRYELFEKVASGGMATVYVGRALGSGGFERVVAVKVCHEHLRDNEQFVTMFLDEARLSAKIRHPNVVGVIDASDVDGLYLVMEYIDGAPLTALLRSCAARNEGLPPPVATRIASDALLGLHAAHELTDAAGNPYDIVHRDVSPPNILVGLDGICRIADFGVAKAAARATETRDGQIKGKIAYMAPEQFDGIATVQSDVFAAGVVLWESLVGQRLFGGNSDAEVMRAVITGTIRKPSAVRSDLPAALDDVVMRALDREPSQRWSSAAAFADALEDCGAGLASARAVTAYLKKDLGEWLESRQGQVRNFLAADVPQAPDSGVVMREPGQAVARARTASTTDALAPGPKDMTPSAPNRPVARPVAPKIETPAKASPAAPPRPSPSAFAPKPPPAKREEPIEEIDSGALKSVVTQVPIVAPAAPVAPVASAPIANPPVANATAPLAATPLIPISRSDGTDDLEDVQTVAIAPRSRVVPAVLATPPQVQPAPVLAPQQQPAAQQPAPALAPLQAPAANVAPQLEPDLASPAKPRVAIIAAAAIAIAVTATGIGVAVARMGRSDNTPASAAPTTAAPMANTPSTSTPSAATPTQAAPPSAPATPAPVIAEPVAPVAPAPVEPVHPASAAVHETPPVAPAPAAPMTHAALAAPTPVAPIAHAAPPPSTPTPAVTTHAAAPAHPPANPTNAANTPSSSRATTSQTATRPANGSTTAPTTPTTQRRNRHGFIPDDI